MAKKSKGKKKYDAAYLKAVEEIEKDKVNEIKTMVKGLLEAIIAARAERKKIDEKLAFLAQDLEDLRHGRVEKIKTRHEEKVEVAKASPINPAELQKIYSGYISSTPGVFSATTWANATSGPFTLGDGSVVTVGPASARS